MSSETKVKVLLTCNSSGRFMEYFEILSPLDGSLWPRAMEDDLAGGMGPKCNRNDTKKLITSYPRCLKDMPTAVEQSINVGN